MNTSNQTIIDKSLQNHGEKVPSRPMKYIDKSSDGSLDFLRNNNADLYPNRFDLFFKKFTNLLMKNGKKAKAIKIFFNMLLILKKRIKKDLEKKNQTSQKEIPVNYTLLHVISRALENLTPSLEVRKVRVAGSTYIVPAVLSKKKQETLALKWILESAKKRQKNSKLDFSSCLADEILDASRKAGQARHKRDELHRLAQLNRAYIRYRWW